MSFELVFLYPVAVLSAAFCLLFCFRLYRRYRVNFLFYYQYFLVFIYISSFLNSIGLPLAVNILSSENINTRDLSGSIFLPLLIPLVSITLYFFFRFAASWLDDSVPRWIYMVYFIFWFCHLLFLAYSIRVYLNLNDSSMREFSAWLTDTTAIVFQYTILLYMIWRSRSATDKPRARGIRIFALIYLIEFFMLDIITSKQLAAWIGYPRSFFMNSLNFLIHLPPLFYLIHFSRTYFQEPYMLTTNSPALRSFFQEHSITKREQEIISLLMEGKSNREIEAKLFISLGTVKNHLYNIYQKAGVNNRFQLTSLMSKLNHSK
jgi:DNA-binding CsgD family transcriptional regulator